MVQSRQFPRDPPVRALNEGEIIVRIAAKRWIVAPTAALLLATAAAPSAVADDGPELAASLTAEAVAAEDALGGLPEQVEERDAAAPPRCDNPYKKWYEITSKKGYHVPSWWNGTSFKDGPGGTMVVKVEKAGKITASITGGTEAEAGAIIAKAKVKVDVTIGAEFAVTVGHEYRRDISRGKYGHLQYGSSGYKITWSKFETSADRCGKKLLKKGKATLPTKETGWKYWETSS